jgi:hypothetical protein
MKSDDSDEISGEEGDVYGEEEGEDGQENLANYKGIYFGDDTKKYECPETGAHFEFNDMIGRLTQLKELRKKIDIQLGIPEEDPKEALRREKEAFKK